MDPFVVISLGRQVTRTKVIRHNLNPVFNEKMVLQVLRHETAYEMNFTVMDRDNLSKNDFIASANFPLKTLVGAAPEADTTTGLYKLPEPMESSAPPPKENKSRFRLPVSRSASTSSLHKISRTPLRSNASQTSLSSGLSDVQDRPERPSGLLAPPSQPADSVSSGSIPSNSGGVANGHGNSNGDVGQPSPEDPDLLHLVIPLTLKNRDRWEDKHLPELHITAKFLPYRALRQQFWRAMLKQYDADESGRVSKIELTTMLDSLGSTLRESTIDGFFGRFATENESADSVDLTFDQAVICLEEQLAKSTHKESLAQKLRGLSNHASRNIIGHRDDEQSGADASGNVTADHSPSNGDSDELDVSVLGQQEERPLEDRDGLLPDEDLTDERDEEHVVEIRECPLCHQPRMGKKTDADIITHVATCASTDWRQVNNFVMGGFVTSSQAQRKWYSKVITKISYGGYKLGANSANILVQDRLTGQINEERMSVYVRLGIRLLYKALGSREMEKKRSK